MKKLRIILITIFAVFVIGCSSNRTARNYTQDIPSGYSMQQIESAIVKGGELRGWKMKKARSGLVTGKIVNRGYAVEIRVPYTKAGFSVEYMSSQNLADNSSRAPNNYNRWAVKLRETILRQLAYQ